MDTDKYVEILGEQIDKLGCQISDVKDEVQLMKEVLNNGIVSATYENTETIKELAAKIGKVEKKKEELIEAVHVLAAEISKLKGEPFDIKFTYENKKNKL